MTDHSQSEQGGRNAIAPIIAAAAITILDGFDAFSLGLMAPFIGAELKIPTATLGTIFSSAMAGMILGAIGGGSLADKYGRLRTLLGALIVFGVAALLLPFASTAFEVGFNRMIAGVGLGAAAPIAVGLLNRSDAKPPSELVIALVWAGIPIGGSLAALYNYAFVPTFGWRSIFVVGGLLPFPIAAIAYAVFRRGTADGAPAARAAKPPQIRDLFTNGQAPRTAATAAMFFFGFVTTAIIVNWLPTILTHRAASPGMISSTFAAINGGGVIGMVLLGFVASRLRWRPLLPAAWLAAAACGLAASLPGVGSEGLALLAIAGATIGASAQGLSIARANELQRGKGLESTSVGFMAGSGRVGQASALGVSGTVIAIWGQETLVFAMAGFCALIAALLATLAMRPDVETAVSPQEAPVQSPS